MKPDNPIVYNEFYLDAMTGGSSELPAPVTPEQHYLAHLAGMTVTLPQPIILRDMFLAKICGMDVDVPTYVPGQFPRKFAYYAKAAGQDVDVPQPITREEMYWFDYVSTPTEKEYTGAVPVTFTADGTPLLDYLISGNTVQSATPTPDSPVMPQGTGERTGNLLLYPYSDGDGNYNGVNVEVGIDGKIVGSGQTTAGTNFRLAYINMKLLAGTYTLSVYGVHTGLTLFIRDTLKGINIVQIAPSNDDRSTTFTLQEDTSEQVSIYFNTGRVGVDVSLSCYVMLNKGQPMDFEPYGYKIPILSADTTTNIYLGEVEATRKIKKLVLTGEEAWQLWNGNYYSSVIDRKGAIGTIFCTHFINSSQQGISYNNQSTSGLKIASIAVPFVSDLSGLKEWLAAQYAAGTPVTVWYVLATEQTAVVNEPLMKIGEYADTLSMEQASVEIPTARGTNTLDVLTDVKPSEIYIKYKE